jgi:hypothetical protein
MLSPEEKTVVKPGCALAITSKEVVLAVPGVGAAEIA